MGTKLETQVARIDERVGYHLKNFDEFKTQFSRHQDKTEKSFKEMNDTLSDLFKDKNKQCSIHATSILKLKRDRKWLYGIFILAWGGVVAWLTMSK